MNADRLSMLFMTIDSQKEIGDESGQDLDHQAMLASCDKMINFEMSLPPSEKLLNIPTKLVDNGNLLSSQVKAICGNPELFVSDLVAN